MSEKKYLVETEYKDGDCFHDVYDTLDEANSEAIYEWKSLNFYEKRDKQVRIYVIEVDKDDLEDELWSSYTDYKDDLAFFDSDAIGSITVPYFSGGSCEDPEVPVDIMCAYPHDSNGEEIELYAEIENPKWNEEKQAYLEEDEEDYWDDLQEMIVEQAEEKGVHESRLSFALAGPLPTYSIYGRN